MKRLVVTAFLMVLTGSQVFSQGGGKAEYRDKFTEGSYLLLEENYPLALKNFLEAYAIDSSNANINYQVGLCYINSTTEKYKAQRFLEKAILKVSDKYTPMEPMEKRAPALAYYYLAKSYHLNYRFDEAIAYFEKFKSYLNSSKQADLVKDVDRQIATCNTAKEFYAAPNKVTITNLGDSVNSPYPEYSPVISADESTLIFTSRRLNLQHTEKTIDDQYYEDIYISYKKPDGGWTTPVPISDSINTVNHDANLGLSADGQQLLVYKDDNGDGNIYSSNLEGDQWTKPVLMGSDINTKSWEPSACVSADGNTFYFVSDRKGGLGGRDLYSCVRLPNGKWSLARNLGPGVNTEYDEEAPFLHPDGVTLFFSSKGHRNMGGFDIFFVSKNDDGKWVDPINMGSPINTPDDDVFYVTSTDGKRAYYSSVREGGLGEKDIYLVTLAQAQKVDPVALILGRLIPGEGKAMPADNEINVTNVESGETAICKANTKTGKFVISLKPGKSYNISYTADGTEVFKETIDVPLGIEYQEIRRDIYLDPQKNVTLVISKDKPNPDSTGVAINKDKPVKDKPVKDKPVREKVKPIKPCDDLVFKVQLGSFKKKLPASHFGVPQMETVQTPSGSYKYFSGIYKTYEEAKVLQKIVVEEKGIKGAFIVSVNCGKITKVDSSVIVAAINMETTKSADPAGFGRFSDRHYEVFFKYNIKEIDIQDPEFQRFIAFIIADVNERGTSTVALTSSASQVPTRAFKSNKELSIFRANKAKENIAKALKEKGVDETKVIYEKFKSYVNGPQYKGDYLVNKAMYEKFQYVKVDILKPKEK